MSEDRLDQLDYYTLLQVAFDASPDRIRAAYHDFARRFHPDRFSGAPVEKRERAAQIFRRGAEAYRVLMNAVTRRRYDEGLAQGRLRIQPDDARGILRAPDEGPRFDAGSSRARPFATKAMQAFLAGDYVQARLNLKIALGYEPDNLSLKERLEEVEARLSSARR
jgi:curved DNA-binding protein CbpA